MYEEKLACDRYSLPAGKCVALLVVSDNSATGVPLAGRSEELQKVYEHARCVILPDMIYKIAGL